METFADVSRKLDQVLNILQGSLPQSIQELRADVSQIQSAAPVNGTVNLPVFAPNGNSEPFGIYTGPIDINRTNQIGIPSAMPITSALPLGFSAQPVQFSVAPQVQQVQQVPQQVVRSMVSRPPDDQVMLNINEGFNNMMETIRSELQALQTAVSSNNVNGLHQTTAALVGQSNDNMNVLTQIKNGLDNVQSRHAAEIQQLINENTQLRQAVQTMVNGLRR